MLVRSVFCCEHLATVATVLPTVYGFNPLKHEVLLCNKNEIPGA
jgi:hypothetical protein